jgi:hypothetical protein
MLALELERLAARGIPGPALAVEPLAALAATRLLEWFEQLDYPVRTGEHGQSAFALGVALDHARRSGAPAAAERLAVAAIRLHHADRFCLEAEPSAYDFLSPGLAAADTMRRALDTESFSVWLDRYWPDLGGDVIFDPVECRDRQDGKSAHLDGLNLSRAWMMEGIASALPYGDQRVVTLQHAAARHLAQGLQPAIAAEHYMTSHWLGSFATYALTRYGCAPRFV